MAKVLTKNYSDSPTAGDAVTWTLPKMNYTEDFRCEVDEPGECRMVNLRSPLGYPEKVIQKVSTKANIYKNADVESTLQSPQKRGVDVLSQLVETWTVTDTEDSTYNVALPVSGNLTLHIPENENITDDDVLEFARRVCAPLYDSNGCRLRSLLRKVVKPTGL